MTSFQTTSRLAALLLAAVLIPACDSADPVNPQGGPARGRAVMNPYSVASANDEVFSRNSGTMELFSVDFSNGKDNPTQVHTVVDDIATVTGGGGAETRPSTAPAATRAATQAAADAGAAPISPVANSEDIKIAAQQKAGDKITMTRDNEANVDIWITSASGIGNLTLERIGDNWPPLVRLHFSYGKDKPFTRLEGLEAAEIAGDHRVALKTSPDKEAGKGQLAIPAFSRAPQIQIQWVDMYR